MTPFETRCELMSRFYLGLDQQDAEMIRSTLTEDAETCMILDGERMGPPPGREGIVGYLEAFWKTQTDQRRHVLSNAILVSESSGEAVLAFYLTLYATKNRALRPVATGRYRVRFVSKPGGERIRSIELVLDGPFD
jgi:hypothetical protein